MNFSTSLTRVTVLTSLMVILLLSIAQVSPHAADPSAALSDIHFSFKLDPRLSGPTYGGERWVSPSTYTGGSAQDTVEAQAQGVNGKGMPAKISPEWIPSDPEMVTVSPTQGGRVKITVHRAGESKLKVAAQGFSKELVVKAKDVGKYIQVEITPLEVEKKPAGATATQEIPALKSGEERLSYAAGMNLAKALQKQSLEVDADLMRQGFKDVLSGGKTLMTEQEVQAALIGVQTDLRNTELALQGKELAEKYKKDGEAFLAENKKKEGVTSLPSGLQYKIVKAGEGKKPAAADVVVCKYRGTLIDGTQFERAGPVSLPVKAVIKGWSEALQLMPVGSKWQLFIPPDLAYGERAPRRSKIPPNATLIFEVELLSIQDTLGVGAQPKAADAVASRDGDSD